MTSIAVAVLVHHDTIRTGRAVQSALQCAGEDTRVVLVSHSKDPGFGGQAAEIASRLGVEFVDSPSQTASSPTGKQACFDWFNGQDFGDYLVQLDGDDYLYSTWRASLLDILARTHYPDAVGFLPYDALRDYPPLEGTAFGFQARPGLWGHLWTTGVGWWPEYFYPLGPGIGSPWVEHPAGVSAQIRAWSRRATESHKFRGLEQGWPEDQMTLFDLLASYQRGDLLVWLSMTSDFLVVDNTTPNSDQKTSSIAQRRPLIEKMMETAAGILVDPERSSIGEFPVLWPQSGAGVISLSGKIQEIHCMANALPIDPEAGW